MVWQAILAGTAAASAIGQGISAFVPTASDKENKKRLAELEALKAKGQLGITDEEYQRRARDLQAPIQAAGAQVQQAQARALAAGGQLGGRDLSAMRQEQAQMLGSSNQQVQAALDQADETKKAAQQAEMDARRDVKSDRDLEKRAALFNTLNESIKAAGALEGAPPGTFSATGDFGRQPTERATTPAIAPALGSGTTSTPGSTGDQIMQIISGPDGQALLRQAMAGTSNDPQVLILRQLLQQAEAAGQAPI
jgi:hypothetical protein